MTRKIPALVGLLTLCVAEVALAARVPVLRQIDLPHSYYYREMLLPQLTSGPSGVDFSPDGQSVVYSMAGSLWLQRIGDGVAEELTYGPGYDYQPDWSPDGRSVVFVRHQADSLEIWRLDLGSRKTQQLTQTKAVQLQPRISPDGKHLAFVSTVGTGHLNLFVADLSEAGVLGTSRAVIEPQESKIYRYYYSTHDHAINPSWTPDGKSLVFVSNHEIAYGSGRLCNVNLEPGSSPVCFLDEETSWRANPEVAPDGRRVLYSSYQGRQWHQLWVTTLAGNAALPLSFGEFDATQARWSPDGRRVAYISNETGNVTLWIRDFVGGARQPVVASTRRYARAMSELTVKLTDEHGKAVSGRISVVGSDARAYAPKDSWISADDSFDPATQSEETRYFHCHGECVVTVPVGVAKVTAWRGQQFAAVQRTVQIQEKSNAAAVIPFKRLVMPSWAPAGVSADLHVHMNYGGHYRNTLQTLAAQARAEDLDVIYNTIVNKEQRIPDIAYADGAVTHDGGVTIFQAQEFHTSYWGHLGLLDLKHFLTPDFSAYQQSALTSPYPHNGAVADLAHAQGALVGYVHPFDWQIVPEKEKSLTNALPVDVALGKANYIEVVGFSDHKATAEVWHRLLNLGFRLSAGAGTDAMANYASLRGPVGMNRVFLQTGGDTNAEALHKALKEGHGVASNGPLLALQVDGKNPGDTIELESGSKLSFRAAMRSLAPLDHVEVLYNGRVVARHGKKDATSADLSGAINVTESGWILLRAWNDDPDPLIFDLYPYASTSPVYVSVGGQSAESPADAEYFLRWIDRIIASADARQDYNDAQEKKDTMDYLRAGRAVFEKRVGR
jgi:Tol biopolymer transport system component